MKIFVKTGFFKFAPKRWSKVLFPENKRPVFCKILQQISYFLAFFSAFYHKKNLISISISIIYYFKVYIILLRNINKVNQH